jgi:hypothetical protein
VDVEKYLLDKILGLSLISKNSLANIPDGTHIASEEQGKSLTVAGANFTEECLVGKFR